MKLLNSLLFLFFSLILMGILNLSSAIPVTFKQKCFKSSSFSIPSNEKKLQHSSNKSLRQSNENKPLKHAFSGIEKKLYPLDSTKFANDSVQETQDENVDGDFKVLLDSPFLDYKNPASSQDLLKIANHPKQTLPQLKEVDVPLTVYVYGNLKEAVNLEFLRLYGISSTSTSEKTTEKMSLFDLKDIKSVYHQIKKRKSHPILKSLELVDSFGMDLIDLALMSKDQDFIVELQDDPLVCMDETRKIAPILTHEDLSLLQYRKDLPLETVCRHLSYFGEDYNKIQNISLDDKGYHLCSLEKARQVKHVAVKFYGPYHESKENQDLYLQKMMKIYSVYQNSEDLSLPKKYTKLVSLILTDMDGISLLHIAILKKDWKFMEQLLKDNLIHVHSKTTKNHITPSMTCLFNHLYQPKFHPVSSHAIIPYSAITCMETLFKYKAAEGMSEDEFSSLFQLSAMFGDIQVLKLLSAHHNLDHHTLIDLALTSLTTTAKTMQEMYSRASELGKYFHDFDSAISPTDFRKQKMAVALYLLSKCSFNKYTSPATTLQKIYEHPAIQMEFPEVIHYIHQL